MAQTYETLISGTTTFGVLYGRINNLVEALRSSFSGTSFPTTPSPVEGQFCYRTDRDKLYVYRNDVWEEVPLSGTLWQEVVNARGTKPNLDQRLDVALNEDGTLKANVTAYQSQWVLPSLTFEFVSSTSFRVNGDQRDIYVNTRRIKANLATSAVYSEVTSSSYNSANNKTTVQIANAVLNSTLISVEHSIISPLAGNGAVTPAMIGLHATSIPTTSSAVVSSDRGSFIRDGWNRTSANLTLYVDNVNGNDTTGNGSLSNPYATVTKALSELPSKIANAVIIVLKKSSVSYGTILLGGLTMSIGGRLTIQGEFDQLVSGTVGSFNNSVNDPIYGSLVTVARITDSSKAWVTNQFQNKLIRVYKGTTSYFRTICHNDATSIYCNQTFPVTIDNTWNYEILDWGSFCDYIQLDDNNGTINIQNLKVIRPSNFQCAVLRRTSVVLIDNCLFISNINDTFPTIQTAGGYLTINNSIINANNNSHSAIFSYAETISTNFIQIQGCLIFNNSSPAILNNYFFSRIQLNNGTRLYKGTSNPTIGVKMLSGMLIGVATYERVLIDVGQTGIILTQGAYVQSNIAFVFGSNVTTKISSYLGLVDGGNLQVYNNFGVNIPNNDHENIHSSILCNGSFATRVDTVSANTTLNENHNIVLVTASGGARTITLPNAADCAGRQYVIKKIDSSSNAVTITPQSGQTIDGQTSISMNTQYSSRRLVSGGTHWYLF